MPASSQLRALSHLGITHRPPSTLVVATDEGGGTGKRKHLHELVHGAGDACSREEHNVAGAVGVVDAGVDRLSHELAGLDSEAGGLFFFAGGERGSSVR